MATGTIRKWEDGRGYGFIRPDAGGPDIFLHRSQVLGCGIDPYDLRQGLPLSYEIGLDRNDRPIAVNVSLGE